MKRYLEAAASTILGVVLLYVVLSHFGRQETIASIRRARPLLLLLGSALMVSSYFARAARWPIWERSLSYWDSARLVLIWFMGNNVLPARLGEVLRAWSSNVRIFLTQRVDKGWGYSQECRLYR